MGSAGWAVVGSLGGALIGVLGGLVGAYLSVRTESQRHRNRLAFELGFREWEHQNNYARELAKSRGGPVGVAPAYGYVLGQLRVLEMVERGGITEETVARFIEENRRLQDLIFKLSDRRGTSGTPAGS